MEPSENLDCRPVIGIAVPLALNCIHLVPPSRDDEINLMPLLVAPVTHRRIWKMGLQMFEHKMLPKGPEVLGPQRVPASREADEPGVKCIHLRLFHQLMLAAAVVSPDQGDRIRNLHRPQVAPHRRPGDAQGRRGPRRLELPAALPQHVLEQGVEAVYVPETEQRLNVPREKRVHPFAVERRFL